MTCVVASGRNYSYLRFPRNRTSPEIACSHKQTGRVEHPKALAGSANKFTVCLRSFLSCLHLCFTTTLHYNSLIAETVVVCCYRVAPYIPALSFLPLPVLPPPSYLQHPVLPPPTYLQHLALPPPSSMLLPLVLTLTVASLVQGKFNLPFSHNLTVPLRDVAAGGADGGGAGGLRRL